MKVLVIGGSGFVGSAVVRRAAETGIEVGAEPAPRLRSTGRGPEAVLAEARAAVEVAALAARLGGVDAVVLAAGAATPDAPDGPALRGANALLPAVVALACGRAGVPRLVHLSSAAVQGRTARLDETATTRPFSPYSRSKATGEQVLDDLRGALPHTEVVVVRATSVQGPGRSTTEGLRRVARSPFASVAGRGDRHSPVSALDDLADFVVAVATWPGPVAPIVLQPWGGLTTADVLVLAGGRRPRRLPALLCRLGLGSAFVVSRLLAGRGEGPLRRLETMWFGQEVDDRWARQHGLGARCGAASVLRAGAAG